MLNFGYVFAFHYSGIGNFSVSEENLNPTPNPPQGHQQQWNRWQISPGRGCGGVNSFDSTPIHSQQYSCIKSVNQNKFCNYARRTEKIRRFLFHEAQKKNSHNRETLESLQGKKQQKHVCLVAFQTQTQNRSVLATLLPKPQQLRNFPNRNPAPGVSSKTQFQIANRN